MKPEVRPARVFPVFIRQHECMCVSSFMCRRRLSSHMLATGSPLRGTFVSKMEMVEPFQYSQFLWVFSRIPS